MLTLFILLAGLLLGSNASPAAFLRRAPSNFIKDGQFEKVNLTLVEYGNDAPNNVTSGDWTFIGDASVFHSGKDYDMYGHYAGAFYDTDLGFETSSISQPIKGLSTSRQYVLAYYYRVEYEPNWKCNLTSSLGSQTIDILPFLPSSHPNSDSIVERQASFVPNKPEGLFAFTFTCHQTDGQLGWEVDLYDVSISLSG